MSSSSLRFFIDGCWMPGAECHQALHCLGREAADSGGAVWPCPSPALLLGEPSGTIAITWGYSMAMDLSLNGSLYSKQRYLMTSPAIEIPRTLLSFIFVGGSPGRVANNILAFCCPALSSSASEHEGNISLAAALFFDLGQLPLRSESSTWGWQCFRMMSFCPLQLCARCPRSVELPVCKNNCHAV